MGGWCIGVSTLVSKYPTPDTDLPSSPSPSSATTAATAAGPAAAAPPGSSCSCSSISRRFCCVRGLPSSSPSPTPRLLLMRACRRLAVGMRRGLRSLPCLAWPPMPGECLLVCEASWSALAGAYDTCPIARIGIVQAEAESSLSLNMEARQAGSCV